jgi:hypothetical protein
MRPTHTKPERIPVAKGATGDLTPLITQSTEENRSRLFFLWRWLDSIRTRIGA